MIERARSTERHFLKNSTLDTVGPGTYGASVHHSIDIQPVAVPFSSLSPKET